MSQKEKNSPQALVRQPASGRVDSHRWALPPAPERDSRGNLPKKALWNEVKDMPDLSGRRLSGGQQQSQCPARVLSVEPQLILMDKPVSALDAVGAYRIEQLLLQLCSSYTIVLVTRNMFQAARVAKTTAFLMRGEVMECVPTEQVFESPRDERTDNYRGRVG